MKKDEFIERIREGIDHGMWIAEQVDRSDTYKRNTGKSMKEWMARQIVEMLDTMQLLGIIDIDELRDLNKPCKSYLHRDLYRWYPEEMEKKEKEIAEWKKKGGQAPEVSSAVDNDETTTNSSFLSIPQEEENGK